MNFREKIIPNSYSILIKKTAFLMHFLTSIECIFTNNKNLITEQDLMNL